MSRLSDISIIAWIKENNIKTESGVPLDFKDHMYMWDIYGDDSPLQCGMKGAQVTWTTMAIIKSFWIVKKKRFDAIYTLPTESDVHDFAGGKVNRMIAQNPILREWTKDKDTVEQKQVGDNLIYYRGTWTSKAAIMVASDFNINDEIDSSKQDVIEQYFTRLQHSLHKWHWVFSHPSSENTGVHKYWLISDQHHWFITCGSCEKEQYLDWPESLNFEKRCYQCKHCKAEITDDMRRRGRWIAKYKQSTERPYRGYWVPLLVATRVTAGEIIDYHNTKSEEYFYNKILGKPYVSGGNKLTKQAFLSNLTEENLYPDSSEPCVMGLDTGTQLYYELMTRKDGADCIFHYGVAKDYDEIEEMMARWPRMKVICDQMGDLIGSRALREKHPGRVWLCLFGEDRKTKELIRWGKADETGSVIADRNRLFRLAVGEFQDRRVKVMGTEEDWDEYMLHWNNLTQVTALDPVTGSVKSKKWVKNGQSDFPFAHLYARIGMSRFGGEGKIMQPKNTAKIKESPEILPGNKMQQTRIYADTNINL